MTAPAGSDLARRLRVRAGDRVVVIGDDAELLELLRPLPPDARLQAPGPSDARTVIVVASDAPGLPDAIRRGARALHEHGLLWVVWRDRTPGVHLASVRRTAVLAGLEPEGTARIGDGRAAASFRRDRDDRTFRDPDLRV